MMNADVAEFQNKLLATVSDAIHPIVLSDELRRAFLSVPRHLFVKKFRGESSFRVVNDDTLAENLPLIYSDRALIVSGGSGYDAISSNSQPSFILSLLQELDLKDGQKVLEVGSGTGWLAAIIAKCIGENGKYVGVEILDWLATESIETLKQANIANARIISGDGGAGVEEEAPFDRVIFTAGTFQFPEFLFGQVVDGGKIVIPFKHKGINDSIYVLVKCGNSFCSQKTIGGSFVPLKGQLESDETALISLADLLGKLGNDLPYRRLPFYWAGSDPKIFIQRTGAFRAFLNISETNYVAVTKSVGRTVEDFGFGVYLDQENSLAIFFNNELVCYGNATAERRLKSLVDEWVHLGMPDTTAFSLQLYRRQDSFPTQSRSWVQPRGNVVFTWTLA